MTMIIPTHTAYLSHLSSQIITTHESPQFWEQLKTYVPELSMLTELSLDPVRDDLEALYCPHGNGRPKDPAGMLRSWLLMTLCREGSPTVWATRLRREPVLAILAGFTPDDTPGATTHRDFLTRLLDGPYAVRKKQDVSLSQQLTGRHRRCLGDTTIARRMEADAEGKQLSDALADHLLSDDHLPRQPHELQTRLDALFVALGLQPTLQDSILPEGDLTVAGDGTVEPSAASRHGTRACDCPPGSRCDCPRDYLSKTAQFCYDQQHGYAFGDRSYTISAHVNGRDIPLITIMGTGNESDFTLSLKALDRLLAILEELNAPLRIAIFLGDGHHNAMGIYRYLNAKGIIPIIPLNEDSQPPNTDQTPSTVSPSPAGTPTPETTPVTMVTPRPHVAMYPDLTFEPDGTPLCPGGCRMRHYSFAKAKRAHHFICPARHGTRSGYRFAAEECPLHQDCCPEKQLGYMRYIKSEADLRLFPPIPRDSTRFKELYAQRSGTERQNAVADSYNIDRRHRNAAYTLIRLTVVNICKHARIREAERTTHQSKQVRFHAVLDRLHLRHLLPN
jgi:hypothetical protein